MEIERYDAKGKKKALSFFAAFGITNLLWESEAYEPVDLILQFRDKRLGVEVKTRNIPYNTHYIQSEGVMLEKKRYDAMLVFAQEKELDRVYYFNIFSCGTMTVKDISKMEDFTEKTGKFNQATATDAYMSEQKTTKTTYLIKHLDNEVYRFRLD
jgi:hypothetical protein